MASAIGWWAWCTGGLVTFWETLEIWKGRGSDAWEPTAAMLNPRALDLLGVFEKYPGVLRFNHSNKPCNHAVSTTTTVHISLRILAPPVFMAMLMVQGNCRPSSFWTF